MKKEQALAIRHKIERAASSQTDEQALESIELFPRWTDKLKEAKETGKDVELGLRVQDEGKLWKCIQPHVPQADWNPSLTPALWKEVSLDEWPDWVRPISAETAYNIGDKVTFEGQHYVSLINANTWSPVEYAAGWELQP